ncbi:MAG: hypothetical protein HDT48_01755 [Ruminococcaceae bacterium]|nr:hypothetical protein [Oscillospiraceae bacterium]
MYLAELTERTGGKGEYRFLSLLAVRFERKIGIEPVINKKRMTEEALPIGYRYGNPRRGRSAVFDF